MEGRTDSPFWLRVVDDWRLEKFNNLTLNINQELMMKMFWVTASWAVKTFISDKKRNHFLLVVPHVAHEWILPLLPGGTLVALVIFPHHSWNMQQTGGVGVDLLVSDFKCSNVPTSPCWASGALCLHPKPVIFLAADHCRILCFIPATFSSIFSKWLRT